MIIVDLAARDRELKAVYGLSKRQFAAKQDEPGTSVNSLGRNTFSQHAMRYGLLEHRLGAAGAGHREAAKKRRTGKSPGPPPAAAATQARSANPPALAGDSRGSGARSSRDGPSPEVIVYGTDPNGAGPASRLRRIQLCAHLQNKQMEAANHAGKRQKPPYRSHTDRYRSDPVYKAQMMRQDTPEWLVFSDGKTHRLDGLDGDQQFPM